jgi:hypothetical protein
MKPCTIISYYNIFKIVWKKMQAVFTLENHFKQVSLLPSISLSLVTPLTKRENDLKKVYLKSYVHAKHAKFPVVKLIKVAIVLPPSIFLSQNSQGCYISWDPISRILFCVCTDHL